MDAKPIKFLFGILFNQWPDGLQRGMSMSKFDSYYRSTLIILPLNLLRLSLQVDSHYRSTLNTGFTVYGLLSSFFS